MSDTENDLIDYKTKKEIVFKCLKCGEKFRYRGSAHLHLKKHFDDLFTLVKGGLMK